MNNILVVILGCCVTIVFPIMLLFFLSKKKTDKQHELSKDIVYRFTPEETFDMDKMIEYHRKNKIKYNIKD